MRLKTVRVPRGYHGLHCEVDGCIVNIRIDLHSAELSQKVTAIEVLPDRYTDPEGSWEIIGNNGVVRVQQTGREVE